MTTFDPTRRRIPLTTPVTTITATVRSALTGVVVTPRPAGDTLATALCAVAIRRRRAPRAPWVDEVTWIRKFEGPWLDLAPEDFGRGRVFPLPEGLDVERGGGWEVRVSAVEPTFPYAFEVECTAFEGPAGTNVPDSSGEVACPRCGRPMASRRIGEIWVEYPCGPCALFGGV